MNQARASLIPAQRPSLRAFPLYLAVFVSPAWAAGLDLSPASVTLQPAAQSPVADTPTLTEPDLVAPKPFGARGTSWFTVGAGIGHDFSRATDSSLYGSFSYFVADDVEIAGELGAWYFSQAGDDALGLAPMVVFRWHFVNRQSWSLFADAGIGVLLSTDDVPEDGTSFNFSPCGRGFHPPHHRFGHGAPTRRRPAMAAFLQREDQRRRRQPGPRRPVRLRRRHVAVPLSEFTRWPHARKARPRQHPSSARCSSPPFSRRRGCDQPCPPTPAPRSPRAGSPRLHRSTR